MDKDGKTSSSNNSTSTKIVSKDTSTKTYKTNNGSEIKFTKAMSIYDSSPKNPDHSAVHINYDNESGKYTVTEHGPKSEGGGSNTASGNCFLTSACMKHFMDDFDDNCEELTVLRWFRDRFVSFEDIAHYYEIAPKIIDGIESVDNNDIFYAFIYENIVRVCVNAIKNCDYDFAYSRYKNAVLALENELVNNRVNDDNSATPPKVPKISINTF